MAAEGIAYVPAACDKNITACRIHVNYHGCVGPHPNAVANVARNAGFSEHAESNSIVLVFPAVNSSINYGCWDWDGSVVGELFDTKQGGQLQTVIAMIGDLQASIIGPLPPAPPPPACPRWKLKVLLNQLCAPWTSAEECEACAETHAEDIIAANCSAAATPRAVVQLCSAPH